MSLDIVLKLKKSILTHHIISISSLDIALVFLLIAYGLFSIPVQIISFNNQPSPENNNTQYYQIKLDNMNVIISEIQTDMKRCIEDNKAGELCSFAEFISRLQTARNTSDSLITKIQAQNTSNK